MTASAAAVSLTTEVVRQGLPLEKRCGCNRRLPLRVQVSGLLELSQAMRAATTPPSAGVELLTYKCGGCGQMVGLTLGDLYLEVLK